MGTKYIIPSSTTYPGSTAYPIQTRIDDDGEYTIPANAVEVDEAIFQRSITEPAAWLFDPATGGLVAKPAPTEAEQLPGAQAAKLRELYRGFQAATYADIPFTNAAAVASTYQADETSRARISRALASYTPVNAVPAGFYWVDSDNVQQPMTLADLQGLAKSIADREWGYFQHLQDLKGQAQQATTLTEVAAVLW